MQPETSQGGVAITFTTLQLHKRQLAPGLYHLLIRGLPQKRMAVDYTVASTGIFRVDSINACSK